MEVSIFKNVKDVSNAFHKDIYYILDRIKNGKSKEAIKNLRTLPPASYQQQKSKLPAVCFNGTFKHRSLAGLINKSGLIILDFDKFDNHLEVIEFKEKLKQDEYVFAVWISPSNKGLKVLVKIPIDEHHKEYFDALKLHFNHPAWDDSGSDIPRVCYESYDPEIYINKDSKIWSKLELQEYENLGSTKPVVPIKSDNRIIENLMKWWKTKYGNSKGSRNKNLFVLAMSFNSFGIDMYECENVFLQFKEPDFTITEINKIIQSAYKNKHIFRTKFFEDNQAKSHLYKQVISGKKTKEIEEDFPNFTKPEIEKAISDLKEKISIDVFWAYDENMKLRLVPHKYKFWLQQNNFFKYFPTDSNTYTFIRRERNLIEETNEKRIKDFVLEELLNRDDNNFHPYDFMSSKTNYFSSDFLSFLESAEINLKQDTAEECFLYFKNCVVKVTKDTVEEIDYIDVDGVIWKRQIIDRDFKPTDHHDAMFRKFVYLIAGEDMQKYNSFKSVIGYLLHSFKTSANNKAIILNDETISENPNGGSGKGLFCTALGYMKKISSIDGKNFEFTKSFPYQTVSTDTQILVFDDVKKTFQFENLFSLITEGITLEYKGQDAIKLPVTKSPKIVITTNYTIGGVGGSFERRKFEVEMSSYFNSNHTPYDEFGKMFFDDWSDEEWSMFDNFMINCVQFYLKNGLCQHDFKNLETRKFIKETSFEFYEWSEENLYCDVYIFKTEQYEKFIQEHPDFRKWLTQKRFSIWLESFANFHNFKFTTGKMATGRYIKYEGNKPPKQNDDEPNF